MGPRSARFRTTATLRHRPPRDPTSAFPPSRPEVAPQGVGPPPARNPDASRPVTNTPSTPFNLPRFALGWLLPGLGQIAGGNRRRGLQAMAGVLFLFVSGILVGGIDCVDSKEDRLWFFGQAACGPITFAVDQANSMLLKSGRAAPLVEMPSPRPDMKGPQMSTFKGLAHANEFGTLFVFLAGLLNLCVMLDAGAREPDSDGRTSGRRSGEGATQ